MFKARERRPFAQKTVLSSVLSFGTTSYLLAAKSQTALTASYYGAHCRACVTQQHPGLHRHPHTRRHFYTGVSARFLRARAKNNARVSSFLFTALGG